MLIREFMVLLKGMKTILFALTLLLFGVNGFSQTEQEAVEVERAYQNFKKTFSQEFSQPITNSYSPVSFLPPAKLPPWFFHFDDSYPGLEVYHGISDAGLDSVSAYRQALGRALALAAFSQKTYVQNIHDNYYQDRNGQRTRGMFNTFTTYSTETSVAFNVLETYYTHNSELLVLIETGQNFEDTVSVLSTIELFQSEGENEIISRMEMTIDIDNLYPDGFYLNWLMKESRRGFELESKINGKKLPVMNARFLYHPSDNSPLLQEFAFSFDLKHSLSVAFLNALAINLEQFEVFDSQIKTVSEQNTGRFQDLTRIIFTDEFSFNLSNIQIHKNQLILTLKKINQP